MHPSLTTAYSHEMAVAKTLFTEKKYTACFQHLERAHILGQRYYVPHVVSHWWMLKLGWKQNDSKEVIGQIVRSIASVASLLGWVPIGNTGGSNISALKSLPIPTDLKPYLATEPPLSKVSAGIKLLAITTFTGLAIYLW